MANIHNEGSHDRDVSLVNEIDTICAANIELEHIEPKNMQQNIKTYEHAYKDNITTKTYIIVGYRIVLHLLLLYTLIGVTYLLFTNKCSDCIGSTNDGTNSESTFKSNPFAQSILDLQIDISDINKSLNEDINILNSNFIENIAIVHGIGGNLSTLAHNINAIRSNISMIMQSQIDTQLMNDILHNSTITDVKQLKDNMSAMILEFQAAVTAINVSQVMNTNKLEDELLHLHTYLNTSHKVDLNNLKNTVNTINNTIVYKFVQVESSVLNLQADISGINASYKIDVAELDGVLQNLNDTVNSILSEPIIHGYADRLNDGDQTYAFDANGYGGPVIFSNVGNNVGEMLNVNNGTFIAPITGIYVFTLSVLTNNADPRSNQLWFNYNGVRQQTFASPITVWNSAHPIAFAGTLTIQINKNDYIDFRMFQPQTPSSIDHILENLYHTFVKWVLIQAL